MIIRKPYAFLIKHFRKIHIFLFVLCGFILYKTTRLNSFIHEFLRLGTYNENVEPISRHINFFVYLILLIMIVTFITIIILLKKKNKPWKAYLIPSISYSILLIMVIYTSSFFKTYNGSVDTITMRAVRDIIFMVNIFQYVTFLILIIRILGVDLNKFDFKSDNEFLELNEDDREEIEINIEFDKYSIKRNIKMFLRNAKYYYMEHKKIIHTLCSIMLVFGLFQLYNFIFVVNKSYKQGDKFVSNGYEISINNSYYSDKDLSGNVIDKNSGFIVVNVDIKNLFNKRDVNFKRFHVMNGTNDYFPTFKLYQTEFLDFGNSIDQKILYKNESINTNLIYKVKKNDKIKNFVMYYQEFGNTNSNHLRKIKLNLKDLQIIKNNKKINFGGSLNIKYRDKDETIIFDSYELFDRTTYMKEKCAYNGCMNVSQEIISKPNHKILKLGFGANYFDGLNLTKFLEIHGKLVIKDNAGKEKIIPVKSVLTVEHYLGKYVYLDVPNDIVNAKNVELNLVVRNNKYRYILK